LILSNDKTGIVILAAGASSRMGSPKQLLFYKGKTLLRHAIDEAVNTNADCVVVVVGANAALYLHEIDVTRVAVVENKEWQNGMASSLIVGLEMLLKQGPQIEGVIFMLCDQPFVSSAVLNDLMKRYTETNKPIVVSNYGETTGPPAFFHQSFFDELMKLKGDEGAKKIIKHHQDEMETILFPQGRIDIDSSEDYESLAEH
jgi:molybdenum cofactor cytidylyltransferase